MKTFLLFYLVGASCLQAQEEKLILTIKDFSKVNHFENKIAFSKSSAFTISENDAIEYVRNSGRLVMKTITESKREEEKTRMEEIVYDFRNYYFQVYGYQMKDGEKWVMVSAFKLEEQEEIPKDEVIVFGGGGDYWQVEFNITAKTEKLTINQDF